MSFGRTIIVIIIIIAVKNVKRIFFDLVSDDARHEALNCRYDTIEEFLVHPTVVYR